MKLSELVAFRNRLNEITVDEAHSVAKYKLDQLMHLVEQPLEQPVEQLTEQFLPDLKNKYELIEQAFNNFDQSISLVKQRVHEQISEQEKHFFQLSYRLFEEAETCETTEGILYGRQPAGEKSADTVIAEEILQSRLASYSSWHVSGMVIRPGIENFVNKMVGCDPLYIIDRNYDLLQPCLKRFPKLYQTRLRPYSVNDWSDSPILDKIPNNQFGVCLAYKVFDYRPLEVIRRYLEEIYQKLCPGGALLMTFNDCDNSKGVMLVEQFCASYTPGYLIRDLATSIGYQIINSWSDNGPTGWLELQKPGTFKSLRGGQTLAAVRRIDSYLEDVDYLKRRAYTQEEILELYTRAEKVNIPKQEIEYLHPYEIQILINETIEKIYQQQKFEEEQRQIAELKAICNQFGVNYDAPDRDELIRLAKLKPIALENNVDITKPNWEYVLEEVLREKEKERQRIIAEEQRIAAEKERQRILELHNRAKELGINPDTCSSEMEIINLIAEEVDRRKKEELIRLRQRAMQLNAGDPNLIRYGYSAEKLKQLIKAKEEGQ